MNFLANRILYIVYYYIQCINLYILRSYSFFKIPFICHLFLNYVRINDFCVPLNALCASQFKHYFNWLVEDGSCPTHPCMIHMLWRLNEYWNDWIASWVLRLFLKTYSCTGGLSCLKSNADIFFYFPCFIFIWRIMESCLHLCNIRAKSQLSD